MPWVVSAQSLATIFTNGPVSNRINIVVLSEGYQTNQLGQFLTNAAQVVTNLLSVAPYLEYKNYFNAFAISVASTKSGSNHNPVGFPTNNTYFSSTYNSFNTAQLLTIPPNDHDSNPAHGRDKVLNLVTNLMPQYDIVIVLVNDTTYGGSGLTPGATNPIIVTSLDSSPQGRDIVAHESGHAFGGLADEYSDPGPSGYVPSEWPNVTAQTNRALIKWHSWIAPTTPIPTSDFDQDDVGLFLGAQYHASGWYRPKSQCKMNILGFDFCPVCSEQLVRSIYKVVDPIDSFLPATTNLSVGSTQVLTFGVTPMLPATHSLAIQWLTNGVTVPGAIGSGFQLSPTNFGNGTHKVTALVSDPTGLVLDDPTHLLATSNIWNLNISFNSLLLVSAQYLANSQFRFSVTGTAPQGLVIEGSASLTNWIAISTNNLTGGHLDYTNSGLTPWRFYRAVALP